MDLLGKLRIHRLTQPIPLTERHPNVTIGRETYGEPRIIGEGKLARLEIGSFCSISEEVVILLDAEHRPDWVTTYPFNVQWPECADFTGHPHTKGDVIIGHDVWIGYGATILSGVSIGTGAVIGALLLRGPSRPTQSWRAIRLACSGYASLPSLSTDCSRVNGGTNLVSAFYLLCRSCSAIASRNS